MTAIVIGTRTSRRAWKVVSGIEIGEERMLGRLVYGGGGMGSGLFVGGKEKREVEGRVRWIVMMGGWVWVDGMEWRMWMRMGGGNRIGDEN